MLQIRGWPCKLSSLNILGIIGSVYFLSRLKEGTVLSSPSSMWLSITEIHFVELVLKGMLIFASSLNMVDLFLSVCSGVYSYAGLWHLKPAGVWRGAKQVQKGCFSSYPAISAASISLIGTLDVFLYGWQEWTTMCVWDRRWKWFA